MSVAAQTIVVDEDRPCGSCGYNLRGQIATWGRETSRWRATCPECGTAQDATSARSAASPSWASVAFAAVALLAAWKLLTWVAFGQSTIVNSIKASALRAPVSPAARTNDLLVDSIDEIIAHVAVHGFRLLLAGVGVGVLASLAPRATGGRRAALACGATVVACLVGTWMYFVGWWESFERDSAVATSLLFTRLSQQGSLPRGEWTFTFAFAVVGLLIATAAARFGVAVGPSLTRWIAGCFAPPDRWPAFLNDRGAR